MRKIIVLVIFVLFSSASTAHDETEAQEFLTGTWVGSFSRQTWVFTPDGDWIQYAGGNTYEGTYSLEAMPANLFVLISGETDKRYVVHENGNSMAVYLEGTSDLIFTGRKEDP